MATAADLGNALIDNSVTRWGKRVVDRGLDKLGGMHIPGTGSVAPDIGQAAAGPATSTFTPKTTATGASDATDLWKNVSTTDAARPMPKVKVADIPLEMPKPTGMGTVVHAGDLVDDAARLGGAAGRGASTIGNAAVDLLNNKWVGGAAKVLGVGQAIRDQYNDPTIRGTAQLGTDLVSTVHPVIAAADLGARGATKLLGANVNGNAMGAGQVIHDAFQGENSQIANIKAARSMDGKNHPFLNMPWQEGGLFNRIQERPVAPVIPAAVAAKDDPTKGWKQPGPVAQDVAPVVDIATANAYRASKGHGPIDTPYPPLRTGKNKDGSFVITNTLPVNVNIANSTNDSLRPHFLGAGLKAAKDSAAHATKEVADLAAVGSGNIHTAGPGVGGGASGGRPARPARVDPYEQEANDRATMSRAVAAGFDPASAEPPKKPTNYGLVHENPEFTAKQRAEDEKYDAQKAGYDLVQSGGSKRPANIVKMEQLRDDLAYEAKYGDVGTFLAAKAALKNFAHLDTNNASRENTRYREAGDANSKRVAAMNAQTEAATKAAEAYIKGTVPKIMVDGKQVDDPNYEPLVRRIISEEGYDPGNLSPQDQADISNAAALSLKAHKQNQKWYDFLPGVTNSSQGPTSNLDDLVPVKTSRRWNGMGSEYDTKAGTLDIRTLTQPEIDLAERFKNDSYRAERKQRKERMAARQAKRKPE